MAASTKKRELNDMNAIACLLVILIHVLSLGISSVTPTSWQAAVIYFPWRLAAFVVPMFLYTGAVKMALHFMDTEITFGGYLRYMLQRVQKIYLPYVLWVVIYYLCFLRIGYVRGEPQEFFAYLLLGNLSSPFYYIVIVMQFYLAVGAEAHPGVSGLWRRSADLLFHAAVFLHPVPGRHRFSLL